MVVKDRFSESIVSFDDIKDILSESVVNISRMLMIGAVCPS